MRFPIDGNLPRSLVPLLQRFGYEAEHVRDNDLSTASDETIAAYLKQTATTLFTRDLDFADVRRYPPAEYSGIIVLRLPDDVIADDIVHVVEEFLNHLDFIQQLPAHLVILEFDRFRFRPALQ